mgnify:CR=1 FL=1
MTLKQLQAKAAELKITGRSKMNKAELEAAIGAATPAAAELPAEFVETQERDYSTFFGTLSKGEARKARKALHASGLRRQAALPAKRAA